MVFAYFQNEAIQYLGFACCSDTSLSLFNGVFELHVKLQDSLMVSWEVYDRK
jgi:hypothetical protein